MGDEPDPNYTLVINRVPKCCGDNQSLLKKTNLAVYTCGHLLCMDCFDQKTDFCRMNDGKKFAFFLNDYTELVEAADALRVVIAEFTTSMRSREGQQMSRLIEKLHHLIQNRLATKPEDIEIAPKPGAQDSPPKKEAKLPPEEVKEEDKSAPSSAPASQGSEDKLPVVVQNKHAVQMPDSEAPNKSAPTSPNTNPLGTSQQTEVRSSDKGKSSSGENQKESGICGCCGKKCSLL